MTDEELQELLNAATGKLGVVGAQLAIYDGHHQREFATGYRDRALALPTTVETLFQIGSTTKVFNAALVMSLVDAGKVDLDIAVREYIPDFRLADTKAQDSITLRHLLSMSAGLDNGTYHDHGRGDDALGRYIEALGGIPQVFPPGAAFGYSNASTCVAGYAVARVMGQQWERMLTERVWAPLGIKHAAFFAEDLLRHPIALGYKRIDSGDQQGTTVWPFLRSIGPAGGMTHCSAGDLIRLARMFLDRGKSAEGTTVLSAEAIATMQRPQITLPTRLIADEWCIGPYRKSWGDHVLYGHSGTFHNGSSMLLWCPEKNVAVATTVNVANQGYPLAEVIFDVLFPHLFGIKKPVAVTPENVRVAPTELRPYVGRYEAFGITQTLTIQGGKLMVDSDMWSDVVTGCELMPLGDDRFLPRDLRVSGNRNWDVAFWGKDASGRATHMLQGVFPLRRTG